MFLPLGFHTRFAYTLTEAEDLVLKRPLAGRAKHQSSTEIGYRLKSTGTKISMSVRWSGERPFFEDTNGDQVEEQLDAPSYTTMDLRFSQFLNPWLRMFVSAENILNAGNHTFLPIQPRTFFGGFHSRL